jgi:hypothetical protein
MSALRYAPGRSLPERAFVPGAGAPRPAESPPPAPSAVARWPARWAACPDYLWGADLYNAGFPWEAHEAWEGLWRVAAPGAHRALLQGLIQCAAAAVKALAGSATGARRLSVRASDTLERAARDGGPVLQGVDARALARAIVAWGRSGGAAPWPPLHLAMPDDDDDAEVR